jgi:hypothetical protein
MQETQLRLYEKLAQGWTKAASELSKGEGSELGEGEGVAFAYR